MPVTSDDLHRRLLALKGAELDYPFGPEVAVFKLRGKVFAMVAAAPAGVRVTLKCDPILAEALREAHPAVRPGYHTDKRHWNTVHLDVGLDEAVLWDMIQSSYELIRRALPKRLQAELAAGA
jgi:predicted DNA-binding protein (MmcQ/YjbR family)